MATSLTIDRHRRAILRPAQPIDVGFANDFPPERWSRPVLRSKTPVSGGCGLLNSFTIREPWWPQRLLLPRPIGSR